MTVNLNLMSTVGAKMFRMGFALALVLSALLSVTAMASGGKESTSSRQRYIVEFQELPLVVHQAQKRAQRGRDSNSGRQVPSTQSAAQRRQNLRTREAFDYLRTIDAGHEEFTKEASSTLRRTLSPAIRYRIATNGMALDLSEEEAAILARSPRVRSISKDRIRRLNTFAGPPWIGAGEIWSGASGFSAVGGENIIVGVIDSGVNWESPSFIDPTIGGYTHTNPLGETLGLCSEPEVMCNNKLIGVYDFVSDLPFTEEEEEQTNGKDLAGHGSHTASIAAGNPVNLPVPGVGNQILSGVAPRANLITYRVCHISECPDSFTLAAIGQAIVDGVDVLNYSIGGVPTNPWQFGSTERAFLNARDAGIVVVTSGGNDGPDESTVGSPANSPWILGVGFATHNVSTGNEVKNLVGGATPPPANITGASYTDGIGQRVIVHASDYGFPLCGVGEPESQPDCEDLTGQSNPWEGQKPFNGEIVVCDRGIYGRVEKGMNLLLAGAGGYILANTPEFGESFVSDDHCLPASHIGVTNGDNLREWLANGSGHGATISDRMTVEADGFADLVRFDSSRGPALPPVEDVLKPNLIAPGVSIYAALENGQEYGFQSGSSMSSPHVAGAAALLKSLHRNWSVSQVVSAIETTATPELGTDDWDLDPATAHEQGAGRPQLGEAANTGVFLDVSTSEFIAANPAIGGKPRDLNLAGLVDSRCRGVCSFTRRVTDHMGGGNWTAMPVDFPIQVQVTVTPANFTLANTGSQELTVEIDMGNAGLGDWIYGRILLRAAGSADQYLTVAVRAYGGDLPDSWTINDDRNGGWREFQLSGISAMQDATYSAGGLVMPQQVVETLVEDPTQDDPFDGEPGVFTTWYSLPQGGLWLYAQTLQSTSLDVDLFVGRDDNGNGVADPGEELCNSRSEGDIEQCDLFGLGPGDYWILVQNYLAGEVGGDEVRLVYAAVAPSEDGNLMASGPGIVTEDEVFRVRLSWDNLDALPGEQLLGAVGVGTSRDTPNNVGIVPVRFNRTGIASAQTFPLINGTTHHLALNANGVHDRLFIDVPPGASRLTVVSSGAGESQNNALTLELKRLEFADAMSPPPFAAPAASAPAVVSATGVGGNGPSITVVGVEPGRWYAVLSNSNDSPSAIEISATVEFQGAPLASQAGLWEPNSRPGLGQGYDDNVGGGNRALIWYTYDEDKLPTWYIAGNPVVNGNIWTSDLFRFTNDSSQQQSAPVGKVSISTLAANDAMFSYTLFGLSGTERMQPISPPTCPQVNGTAESNTGIWYPGFDGLGGASVLVSALTQAQIHYLFDGSGRPRWLFAQDVENPEPTNTELPMLQFSGYCAVCEASAISSAPAGVLTRSFTSESTGNWLLDYLFNSPLNGSVNRTDQIVKLTDRQDCQ